MKARGAARRAAAAAGTAGVLAAVLSGCVTVHGEEAVVPPVTRAEAAKALKHFNSAFNDASRTNDAALDATVETGALGAVDRGVFTAHRKVDGPHSRTYTPLALTDTRYLIPRQAGWPKFFATDSRNTNSESDKRYLFVFRRDTPHGPWKAAYGAILAPEQLADLAVDGHGEAESVPVGAGSGLSVGPNDLSDAYTRYLQDGGDAFAPGPWTSGMRQKRKDSEANAYGIRFRFADTPARAPLYPPFGLRTKDGGALVFFATYHQTLETEPVGHRVHAPNPYVKAILTGTPKQSLTYTALAEQAVRVPPKAKGGPIPFLNQVTGVISAKGS